MRLAKYCSLRVSFLGAVGSQTDIKTNFLLWEGLRGDVDYRTDARVVWLVAMSDNDKTDLEETGTEQSDLGSLSDNSDKSTTESESLSDNLERDTSLSAPYSYETSQVAEAEDSSSDVSKYDRLPDTGQTNRYSAPVHYSSYYSRCM